MEVRQSAEVIPMPVKQGVASMAILRLVKKRVDDKTDFLIAGLMLNIADALFEEMKHLDKSDALSHHLNILRAMKAGETVYLNKFQQLMGRTWVGFVKTMDESHIPIPVGAVAGTIGDFSKRTENHYKVLLRETGLRFQTLLKRKIVKHPLYPDLYYRCFWQALVELDLSYEERAYIMPLFYRFVMDRYGQILAEANRTLIEFQVETTYKLPISR